MNIAIFTWFRKFILKKKRAFLNEIVRSQEKKEEVGTSYAFERAFSKKSRRIVLVFG